MCGGRGPLTLIVRRHQRDEVQNEMDLEDRVEFLVLVAFRLGRLSFLANIFGREQTVLVAIIHRFSAAGVSLRWLRVYDIGGPHPQG